MQIIVYSPVCTPRLEYACHLLIRILLGHEPVIVTDRNEFNSSGSIRISYSQEPFEGALHIMPHTLLFEEDIHVFEPEVHHWSGIPVLFSRHAPSYMPFDPFAAAFWMAARYEEYLPFHPDKHGRFTAEQSLAARNNFLGLPVVHLWAAKLASAIRQFFPRFEAVPGDFAFKPTVDVDIAYAYRHRNLFRTSGGFARSLARGRIAEVIERWKVLHGSRPDPYDQFEALQSLHHGHNLDATWFIEVGKHGKFDKNIDPDNKPFRKLIAGLATGNEVGLHPSYASHLNEKTVMDEKRILENITGSDIHKNRQHFLRLRFPQTYETLIKCGFREDYSMGFHDQPGFRAGLCIPYPWFNLEKNRQENLTIVPFEVMDVTLSEYLKLPAKDALELCRLLADRVRQVNGRFVSIWHNQPALPWKTEDWFELYWQLVHYCSGN